MSDLSRSAGRAIVPEFNGSFHARWRGGSSARDSGSPWFQSTDNPLPHTESVILVTKSSPPFSCRRSGLLRPRLRSVSRLGQGPAQGPALPCFQDTGNHLPHTESIILTDMANCRGRPLPFLTANIARCPSPSQSLPSCPIYSS